jgi:hypothetical protein
MSISIGDSVTAGQIQYTTVARLNDHLWQCFDSNDNPAFISETEMTKSDSTHEFDGKLLQHGIIFADRVENDVLERHRISTEMISEMNKCCIGHWTAPNGVEWRWELTSLSLWRNDVYFAMRLMTPCGRWI